jgi:translation initiation factor IF-3
VRLVGADGQQIGVIDTPEALRQARELDLDLVEVAPQADPPVCRIMDYGKFKYERDVRQKEARRKQSRSGLKEIKFRPKIDPHDYATKKGHVERFLKGGNKVKVTIMFRGREMAHTELGRKILDRLVADLGESIVVDSFPKQEGRNMIMVIGPNKRYVEAQEKAAAKEAKQAEQAAPANDEGSRDAEDEEPQRDRKALPRDAQGQGAAPQSDGQPHAHEEERRAAASGRGHVRGRSSSPTARCSHPACPASVHRCAASHTSRSASAARRAICTRARTAAPSPTRPPRSHASSLRSTTPTDTSSSAASTMT